ncbi:MAG: hypothetical protein NVS1B6_20710 [Steroidobacteraceae bacterium]
MEAEFGAMTGPDAAFHSVIADPAMHRAALRGVQAFAAPLGTMSERGETWTLYAWGRVRQSADETAWQAARARLVVYAEERKVFGFAMRTLARSHSPAWVRRAAVVQAFRRFNRARRGLAAARRLLATKGVA